VTTENHDFQAVAEKANRTHDVVFGERGDNGLVGDVRDLKSFVNRQEAWQASVINWLMGIAAALIVGGFSSLCVLILFVYSLMEKAHP
jgi:hypothetical protein